MKRKTMLVLILLAGIIFAIYMKTRDRSVYYLNLGDEHIEIDGLGYSSSIVENFQKQNKLEKFVEFKYEDYRTADFLRSIKENDYIYIEGKKQTLQNALIKADLVTLSIGKNDLEYGLLKEEKTEIYNYIDTLLLDIEIFLTEIKNYTKEQIMFLGFTTSNQEKKEYVEYMNKRVKNICKRKEIEFIELDHMKDKSGQKIVQNTADEILRKFTFS